MDEGLAEPRPSSTGEPLRIGHRDALQGIAAPVKHNAERFPEDFMFRLSQAEALNRSQLVTGSQKHRDPRFPPYAFTEHGAMMAAMILNRARAPWRRACMSCALS